MTDQPAEPEGLTDDQIATDEQPGALGDTSEASDPDLRNSPADESDPPDDATQPQAGSGSGDAAADDADPADQSDPLEELGSEGEDDGADASATTSPTD